MAKLKRGRAQALVVALWLGAFLLLSCQPAQPVATPGVGEKPAEKAAATATKSPEKAAATPTKAAEKVAETPVRGGTLRLVQEADPPSLDPHLTVRHHPDYGLYDFMIAPDRNLGLTKDGLFKDWTVSGDGKVITFKLREGVKFHDGTDFDAAAAKFNIERMKDAATKSPYRSNYNAVASVDIVDSLTVKFNLTQPDPLLLPRMTMLGGMVVSPTAVKKLGQDFGRKPVGTGAFEFVEWVPSDHITLKRFNAYWGKDKAGNQLPYLDRVVFQTLTDPVTAVANLRTGQVDLYAGSAGIPPDQLPMVKGDPNLYVTVGAGHGLAGIALNTKKPPFDNKALRQAVALAIDREGIASIFGEGGAAPAASLYHPMMWGSDPKIVLPARDLAKAKAKMAEAGYPSGLKVKYTVRPTEVRVAEVTKANLAEIGIDMEIEVVASAVWNARVNTLPGGDYQMAWWGPGNALSDPGHYFGIAFHSQGTRNSTFYSNPQADQLIAKAGSIYDQKERTALYQEAAKIIVDDAPYIPTYITSNIVGMSKKVRNFIRYADNGDNVNEVWLAQ